MEILARELMKRLPGKPLLDRISEISGLNLDVDFRDEIGSQLIKNDYRTKVWFSILNASWEKNEGFFAPIFERLNLLPTRREVILTAVDGLVQNNLFTREVTQFTLIEEKWGSEKNLVIGEGVYLVAVLDLKKDKWKTEERKVIQPWETGDYIKNFEKLKKKLSEQI